MSFWQEFLLAAIDHIGDFIAGILIGFFLAVHILLWSKKEKVREKLLRNISEGIKQHPEIRKELEEALNEIKKKEIKK